MKNLYKSLAAFQQEVPAIHQGTKGYGYTYSDLSTILNVINPLMKKHGLGFTQLVNGMQIKTIVFHVESGEQIESLTDIPQGITLKGMNDFQVLGSAISYLRRYSLSSALCLVTDKDGDAGGEQIPSKPIDYTRQITRLKSCEDMEQLAKVYTAFTPAEKLAMTNTKEQMKTKLS